MHAYKSYKKLPRNKTDLRTYFNNDKEEGTRIMQIKSLASLLANCLGGMGSINYSTCEFCYLLNNQLECAKWNINYTPQMCKNLSRGTKLKYKRYLK